MKKKDLITYIGYSSNQKIVYITRYDCRVEMMLLNNMDDDMVKQLYKHLDETKNFCNDKWFFKIIISIILILITTISPAISIVLAILGFKALADYIAARDVLKKSDAYLKIDEFFNSSFYEDYQEIKANKFNRNKKNEIKDIDKTKVIDVDYVKVINYEFDKNSVYDSSSMDVTLEDRVSELETDIDECFACIDYLSLTGLDLEINSIRKSYDEYKNIKDKLSDEDKIRYLSELYAYISKLPKVGMGYSKKREKFSK